MLALWTQMLHVTPNFGPKMEFNPNPKQSKFGGAFPLWNNQIVWCNCHIEHWRIHDDLWGHPRLCENRMITKREREKKSPCFASPNFIRSCLFSIIAPHTELALAAQVRINTLFSSLAAIACLWHSQLPYTLSLRTLNKHSSVTLQ